MKLPSISVSSHRKTDLENIQAIKEAFNPFRAQLEKVIEVRIFLRFTFHKSDIDDEFMKDIEDEYSYQFLTKMQMLPTKENKVKLLKFRPIEKCDFHLSIESINDKQVKVIHIYPNGNTSLTNKDKATKNKLKSFLSNEDFDKIIQKNQFYIQKKKERENFITNIQNRPIKTDDILLFNREKVDALISKAKDDIIDKQLFAQNNGAKIDLSIESIREKYLTPSNKTMLEQSNEDKLNNVKGKLYHISTIKKRNILTDKKYQFPILNVSDLNEDILEEIMQPIDIPIEIIMKDVNYILDNFPIEELIDLDEGFNNNNNSASASGIKTSVNENNNNNSNSNSVFIKKNSMYQKLKSVSKKEVISVYKQLQYSNIYRIIGICLNLIYWVVFGNINRIQIDQISKQYMYIKLLKELQSIQSNFSDKHLCNKVFIPMLILIVRIECENVLNRKFVKLFNNDHKSKQIAIDKVNEFITAVFDPHCYYNTFTMIGGNASIIKHKFSKSILPKFKEKTYATSNLLEQVFIIAENDDSNNKQLHTEVNERDTRMKFIMNEKVEFFADLLNRVNRNLKKRNLEPIFTVKKQERKKRGNLQLIDLEHNNSSLINVSTTNGNVDSNSNNNKRYIGS